MVHYGVKTSCLNSSPKTRSIESIVFRDMTDICTTIKPWHCQSMEGLKCVWHTLLTTSGTNSRWIEQEPMSQNPNPPPSHPPVRFQVFCSVITTPRHAPRNFRFRYFYQSSTQSTVSLIYWQKICKSLTTHTIYPYLSLLYGTNSAIDFIIPQVQSQGASPAVSGIGRCRSSSRSYDRRSDGGASSRSSRGPSPLLCRPPSGSWAAGRRGRLGKSGKKGGEASGMDSLINIPFQDYYGRRCFFFKLPSGYLT